MVSRQFEINPLFELTDAGFIELGPKATHPYENAWYNSVHTRKLI